MKIFITIMQKKLTGGDKVDAGTSQSPESMAWSKWLSLTGCLFSDHLLLFFAFSDLGPLTPCPGLRPQASFLPYPSWRGHQILWTEHSVCLLRGPGSEKAMITDACIGITGEIWVKSTDNGIE